MPLKTATANTALWAIITIAWLVQSRPYHPSATLWIGSTTLLIVGSVVAERLGNKLTRERRAMWIVLWIICGVLTAASIHVLYDFAHGPDPLRFTFLLNCIMDTIIVMINSLVVISCRWLVGRLSK